MARRGKRTAVRAAMGVIGMLAGALLVLRPFSGHSLLVGAVAGGLVVGAVAEAIQGTSRAPARWLLGGTYLGGAALLMAVPDLPLFAIGAIVGMLLVATGALEVWSGLITRTQFPALLVGAATGGLTVALGSGLVTLALGVITTLWADPILFPMVIALGARLLLVGSGLLSDVWYPPTGFGASTERYRLWGRIIGLVLAVVLLCVGSATDAERVRPSDFYNREVGAQQPGTLVRADPYPWTGSVSGTAIRVLYTTTDGVGQSMSASAVLYVPGSTGGASLPLVVWAHGDTGVAQSCAPSIRGESFGGLVAVSPLLAAGYAVLAPDYSGLGTQGRSSYLVGEAEGHDLLDAVRAAGQIPGLRLGSTVIWGTSQGGHAALWAAHLAPSYAPEVTVAGVAVDAPIDDVTAVFSELSQRNDSRLPSYLLFSYQANYSQVQVADYLGTGAKLIAEETAARCGEVSWAVSNWAAATGATRQWTVPSSGPLAEAMAANRAGTVTVPILVTQGQDDPVVSVAITDRAVQARCARGETVQYRRYVTTQHLSPARPQAPQFDDSMGWIADRFAGRSAVSTCAAAG